MAIKNKKKAKKSKRKAKKKTKINLVSDHQKKIKLLKKLKRKKVRLKRSYLNQLKKISLRITIRERR